MTFTTKSKKPIQTTDGEPVEVSLNFNKKVVLRISGRTEYFDADSASRLAVQLRLMALEVAGKKGEGI